MVQRHSVALMLAARAADTDRVIHRGLVLISFVRLGYLARYSRGMS